MGDKSYIYGLVNPETDKVVYVGLTCNPESRLSGHNSNPCNENIKALLASLNGKRLTMRILEECTLYNQFERERHWIADLLDKGVDLLNVSSVFRGGKMKSTDEIRSGTWSNVNMTVIAREDQGEYVDKMAKELGVKRTEVLRRMIDFYMENHQQ